MNENNVFTLLLLKKNYTPSTTSFYSLQCIPKKKNFSVSTIIYWNNHKMELQNLILPQNALNPQAFKVMFLVIVLTQD